MKKIINKEIELNLSFSLTHLQAISPISNGIYRMDDPVFAFCLPIFQWIDKEVVASNLAKIVEYFCQKSIPHSIFWTFGTHSNKNLVKIFIFPRYKLTDKISSSFNAAFCELTGFVPIGGMKLNGFTMSYIVFKEFLFNLIDLNGFFKKFRQIIRNIL